MHKVLSNEDMPDIWVKRLVGLILEELEIEGYTVMSEEERKPDDINYITVGSETTYDKQVLSQGYVDTHIFQYKIYTFRIAGGDLITDGVSMRTITSEQIARTIDEIMNMNSFPGVNIWDMRRTSVPKRMGNDTNGNTIWDLRYGLWFRKRKEE